jgi:polyhydroxybutyrate depolymerase
LGIRVETRLLRRAAGVLAALVLLAACSDDGDESSGDTTTTTVDLAATEPRPSPGCGSAADLAAGEERVTMESGGQERWYIRHVPPAHDGGRPVPLVVDLHGYSEGAEIHVAQTRLGPYGDEEGFLTVSPQGQGEVARWDTEEGSADLAFIGDLLDHVEETACVDEARIFVTGLSHGAMMTSSIACTFADRVAAVAPVAGLRRPEWCDPSAPVPMMAFHGTADPFVAYDGGLGPATADLPAPDGSGRTLGDIGVGPGGDEPSIPDLAAAWAQGNGCEGEPAEEDVAGDVTRITFPCPVSGDVVFFGVQDGGHTWPGSEFSRSIEAITGHTTFSIDANELMWAFFQDHPRPA